jgi:hypothetical protein
MMFRFQEHLLSRRTLYFVDDQVIFRCRRSEWLETCIDKPNPRINLGMGASLLPRIVRMEFPIIDYSLLLMYYTERSLTNQSDVDRAMAGLARRFATTIGYKPFQGLPSGAFDGFVLFAGKNLYRRRGFPSYSWVGWVGRIDYELPHDLEPWLNQKTWIIWFKRSPTGAINLVWDAASDEAYNLKQNSELTGYAHRSTFQCPTGLRLATTRTTPTNGLDPSTRVLPYHILQFWTLVGFYRLSDVNVFNPSGKLLDRHGSTCGGVLLDGFEQTTFFDSEQPLEVVVLSESSLGIPALQYMPQNAGSGSDFFNIIVVEWSEGVAERRGIGTIRKDAIMHSYAPGPAWKEILLA